MPSVLNVDTLTDAAGTGPVTLTKQSAAKAWAVVDAFTATTAITDSIGISSVSDDALGRYTLSLTNSMDSSVYPVVFGMNNASDDTVRQNGVYATSATASSPSGLTSSAVTCQGSYGQTAGFGEFGYGYTVAVIHGDLA